MRTRLRVALASSIVLAAMLAPVLPAHAATDTTPPQVLDLTVTPSSITFGGTAYTKIVVSVHLKDDTGICSAPTSTTCNVDGDDMASFPGYPTPLVRLLAPAQAPGIFYETLFGGMRLTSGTNQDGWWSMTRIATGLWKGSVPVV